MMPAGHLLDVDTETTEVVDTAGDLDAPPDTPADPDADAADRDGLSIHHKIDCSSLKEERAASALFGYEKGAFSGASGRMEGAFARANGGTLVFNNISRMSSSVQEMIPGVLEKRTFRRFGSSKDNSADIRVIATSNEPLAGLAKRRAFSHRLFHHLNECLIELPALRERKEDIPYLVDGFIIEVGQRFESHLPIFIDEALEFLSLYEWPGNLMELRNVVRRAVFETRGMFITVDCLTSIMNELSIDVERLSNATGGEGITLKTLVGKNEKEEIRKTLLETFGNVKLAARMLGVDRKTLYRKMEKHGIKK